MSRFNFAVLVLKPSPFNHPRLKMTDERGVYRITGLPEGRYLVSVGISPEENANRPLVFENLLPGEYEVRLVSLRHQPGEPHDKGLLKLISSVRQKVSLLGANHAPITLTLDLSRKEGDQ